MAACWSWGNSGAGCLGKFTVEPYEQRLEPETPKHAAFSDVCVATQKQRAPASQAVSEEARQEDSAKCSDVRQPLAPHSPSSMRWFTKKLPRASAAAKASRPAGPHSSGQRLGASSLDSSNWSTGSMGCMPFIHGLTKRQRAAVSATESGADSSSSRSSKGSRSSSARGTPKASTPKRGRLLSLQSSGSLIPALVWGSIGRSSYDGGASLAASTAELFPDSTPAGAPTGAAAAAAAAAGGGLNTSSRGSSSSKAAHKAAAADGSNRSSGDCTAPGLTLVVTSDSDSSHHCTPRGSEGSSRGSGHTAFASITSSAWLSGSLTPDSMASAFSVGSAVSFSSSSNGYGRQEGPWGPTAPPQASQDSTQAACAADSTSSALRVPAGAAAATASAGSHDARQQQEEQQLLLHTPQGGASLQAAAHRTAEQTPEPGGPFWQGSGWSFGTHCEQNLREHMEDRSTAVDLTGRGPFARQAHRAGLFCVFDGHGGHEVAEYLAGQLQQQVLAADPEAIAAHPELVLGAAVDAAERQLLVMYAAGDMTAAAGSTLCVVLLIDDKLCVAHVGDSRAVLARGSSAKQLTRDHKPGCSIEAERILGDDPEAEITPDGYLYSELAVARAIGSAHLKRDPSKKALIATAEVTTLQLQQQDDFVIVATDGLWDRINSNEAVSVARRVLCERPDAAATSRALVERAQRCGSGDNISVITLLLHNRGVVVPRSNSRLFKRPATPSPAPVPAPAATAAAEATAEAAAGAAAAAAASPPPAPAAAPAAEATAEIN